MSPLSMRALRWTSFLLKVLPYDRPQRGRLTEGAVAKLLKSPERAEVLARSEISGGMCDCGIMRFSLFACQ